LLLQSTGLQRWVFREHLQIHWCQKLNSVHAALCQMYERSWRWILTRPQAKLFWGLIQLILCFLRKHCHCHFELYMLSGNYWLDHKEILVLIESIEEPAELNRDVAVTEFSIF
jgi:hypothetical protein